MTFSQVNGVISVTADQPIVNRSWTSTLTVPANGGTAQFDGNLANVRAVEIHGESGRHAYGIRATGAPLTLFSGARDAITLGGAADGAQGLRGSVSVRGTAGFASLFVDDRANAFRRLVTLDAPGSITGLTGAIDFAPSAVSALTLRLGPATAADVRGTAVPTNIVCGGDTPVNVGTGSLRGIAAPLNLLPGDGRPTLNLNARGSADASHDITLRTGTGDGTTATLTGLAPAAISFDNARTQAVHLNLYNRPLNTLTLDGSADATDRTVGLDAWAPTLAQLAGYNAGRVTGLMPAAVLYNPDGVSSLTVHTGTGTAHVTVANAAPPGGSTTLVGHSARTHVTVAAPESTVKVAGGPLTVANTVARGTRLTVSGPSPSPSVVAPPGVPAYQVVTDPRTGQRVSFRPNAVADLTLRPSADVKVIATLVPTTVVAAANSGVHVVGGGVAAPLTVTGAASRANVMLTLDGSADPADRTVTLKSDSRTWFDANRVQHVGHVITGMSAAPVSYDTPSVGFLRLYTGTGVETVNVQALDVPNALVVAHSNDTTITLGSAGTVQAVRTNLQVHGGRTPSGSLAQPRLVIDDSRDPVRQNLVVAGAHLPNGAMYSYDSLPPGLIIPYHLITGFAGLTVWAPGLLDMTRVTLKTGIGGAVVSGNALAPLSLVGSPSAANMLAAGSGTWNLSGRDAGSVGLLSFTGFGNLKGGGGADTFVFGKGASVSGTLDGGGGSDALDYASYGGNVVVNLQTSRATGVKQLAGTFGSVTGASGGGKQGVYNILVGNGGVLRGGNGRRNLLVAGPAGATLIGGDGEDVLIGGTTAYDQQTSSAALTVVMNEWTRTDLSYASRVARLRQGRGIPPLAATTVTANSAGNLLQGGAGLDLFFASPSSDHADQADPETLVPL
jgi:hypothetical protein